jgi:hypothetical protein
MYNANVDGVNYYGHKLHPPAYPNDFRKAVDLAKRNVSGAGYAIEAEQSTANPPNIHLRIRVPVDKQSISSVQADIDNALRAAGIYIRASMARFIDNPRRDNQKQPPVNTPGCDPRVTKCPPAAGNVDTHGDRNDKGVIGNAAEFWGNITISSIGDVFKGLTSGLSNALGDSNKAIWIAGGVALIILLRKK